MPAELFVAGMLEILELNVPARPPQPAARRKAWTALGRHLDALGRKYRNDLGDTAYALVNAASEYAGDAQAPLMSPVRVDALQTRCGSWVDRVLGRPETPPASGSVVDVKPENVAAARRLWAMEATGT